jgi:hypothetical protein
VPKRKAILLQALTAVGALTGCILSLMLDGVTDTAAQLTLPFTAGYVRLSRPRTNGSDPI